MNALPVDIYHINNNNILIINVEKDIKAEKLLKYKDLVTEIQSIGNVKA